jgi:putative phosphoribosyl transferase
MFADRRDAGRQLGQRLLHLRDVERPPVVLGLPRGGVVVAAEVARALDAPLDVLVVRKIGAPYQPELAIGAVTDGQSPRHVFNQELINALGVDEGYLQSEIERELAEVRRRQDEFRRGRPPVPIEGRTVIVVDDGIATGATVRAAIAALRQSNPARLVLAVPVAAPDSLGVLGREVDQLICLHSPINFMAVGRFYSDFEQTTDQEVIALLEEADHRVRGAGV